jgi:hypothetical protein
LHLPFAFVVAITRGILVLLTQARDAARIDVYNQNRAARYGNNNYGNSSNSNSGTNLGSLAISLHAGGGGGSAHVHSVSAGNTPVSSLPFGAANVSHLPAFGAPVTLSSSTLTERQTAGIVADRAALQVRLCLRAFYRCLMWNLRASHCPRMSYVLLSGSTTRALTMPFPLFGGVCFFLVLSYFRTCASCSEISSMSLVCRRRWPRKTC